MVTAQSETAEKGEQQRTKKASSDGAPLPSLIPTPVRSPKEMQEKNNGTAATSRVHKKKAKKSKLLKINTNVTRPTALFANIELQIEPQAEDGKDPCPPVIGTPRPGSPVADGASLAQISLLSHEPQTIASPRVEPSTAIPDEPRISSHDIESYNAASCSPTAPDSKAHVSCSSGSVTHDTIASCGGSSSTSQGEVMQSATSDASSSPRSELSASYFFELERLATKALASQKPELQPRFSEKVPETESTSSHEPPRRKRKAGASSKACPESAKRWRKGKDSDREVEQLGSVCSRKQKRVEVRNDSLVEPSLSGKHEPQTVSELKDIAQAFLDKINHKRREIEERNQRSEGQSRKGDARHRSEGQGRKCAKAKNSIAVGAQNVPSKLDEYGIIRRSKQELETDCKDCLPVAPSKQARSKKKRASVIGATN